MNYQGLEHGDINRAAHPPHVDLRVAVAGTRRDPRFADPTGGLQLDSRSLIKDELAMECHCRGLSDELVFGNGTVFDIDPRDYY